jgi:hypothetical protein
MDYTFDLSRYSAGVVVGMRHRSKAPAPTTAWSCRARDNKHALELATEAAMSDWPLPGRRARNDFVVVFVDAEDEACSSSHFDATLRSAPL